MSSHKEIYFTFHQSLLTWFHEYKRDLPFRIKPTPYRIWVSEIMLQQTRVKAMLPLYDEFLLRFPDMESIAEVSEQEVLKYWSGLGYYSRARNLHKACQYVITNYKGKFPNNLEEALTIPGIGPYTARAILSIAFNRAYAVLDGNVKRVVSRFFAEKDERKWQIFADQFLNSEYPGDHNQAMMELGSLVCLPIPKCIECPIQQGCKAYNENKMNIYPPLKKNKDKISIQMHFYIIMQNGKILLIKDKNRRFFKDIFSIPYSLHPNQAGLNLPKSYTTPQYLLEWLKDMGTGTIPGSARHSITHHSIDIFLHRTKLDLSHNNYKHNGYDTLWTNWENLKKDFPSSISSKIMNFPGLGGLYPG